jgi:hypothetical protein
VTYAKPIGEVSWTGTTEQDLDAEDNRLQWLLGLMLTAEALREPVEAFLRNNRLTDLHSAFGEPANFVDEIATAVGAGDEVGFRDALMEEIRGIATASNSMDDLAAAAEAEAEHARQQIVRFWVDIVQMAAEIAGSVRLDRQLLPHDSAIPSEERSEWRTVASEAKIRLLRSVALTEEDVDRCLVHLRQNLSREDHRVLLPGGVQLSHDDGEFVVTSPNHSVPPRRMGVTTFGERLKLNYPDAACWLGAGVDPDVAVRPHDAALRLRIELVRATRFIVSVLQGDIPTEGDLLLDIVTPSPLTAPPRVTADGVTVEGRSNEATPHRYRFPASALLDSRAVTLLVPFADGEETLDLLAHMRNGDRTS